MNIKDATFSLVVDYDRSHKDGIAAGNFQVVNLDEDGDEFEEGDFVENHYPTNPGKKEVSFRYFHFGRWISPEEVIAEMWKEGYRPAILKELLAVVEQRPELREPKKGDELKVLLMALGSDWVENSSLGCRYCYNGPCHHHTIASFWISSFGRGMGVFVERGQSSKPDVHFLAVRKVA